MAKDSCHEPLLQNMLHGQLLSEEGIYALIMFYKEYLMWMTMPTCKDTNHWEVNKTKLDGTSYGPVQSQRMGQIHDLKTNGKGEDGASNILTKIWNEHAAIWK